MNCIQRNDEKLILKYRLNKRVVVVRGMGEDRVKTTRLITWIAVLQFSILIDEKIVVGMKHSSVCLSKEGGIRVPGKTGRGSHQRPRSVVISS